MSSRHVVTVIAALLFALVLAAPGFGQQTPFPGQPSNQAAAAGTDPATNLAPLGKDNIWVARNVDIRNLIQIFAEKLEMSVFLDASVQGFVSCQIYGKNLSNEQYRMIFETVLRESDMRIKKGEGNVYVVERVMGKGLDRLKLLTKEELAQKTADEMLTIGIFPLKYSNTGDMQKFLIPLMSNSGVILTNPIENMLILIDYPSNLNSISRLCELADVQFERSMVDVKYLDTETLVGKLREYYSFEFQRRLINIVAFPQIARIGIVTTSKEMMAEVTKTIQKLDVEEKQGGRQTFVYQVKFKKAEDVAGILGQFYGAVTGGTSGGGQAPRFTGTGTPFGGNRQRNGQQNQPRRRRDSTGQITNPNPQNPSGGSTPTVVSSAEPEDGTSEFQDSFHIVADAKTNKLLIQATPADYRIIKTAIEQLDVQSKQVLVEVTIGEVILSGDLLYGVEWALRDRGVDGNKTVMADQNSGFSIPMNMNNIPDRSGIQGFSYLLGKTDKFMAFMNSLETRSEMTILASPHILALDNEQATIEITDDIPIPSRFTDQSGVVNTYDYRKAGIILTVLPIINDDRMVTLEISLESSSVGAQIGDQPSFFTRSFQTKAYMEDAQTLVIGGLIKQSQRKASKGVPILSRIPVLGALFGSKSKSKESSELIVVITPRVIGSSKDIDPLSLFIETERMKRAYSIMKNRSIETPKKDKKKNKKEKKKAAAAKTNFSSGAKTPAAK